MWLQAWEGMAGKVFWEAMSHEDGQIAPILPHYEWATCSRRWVSELSWMYAATWHILDKLDLLHTRTATVLGVHALLLAARGCRAGLCEERPVAAPVVDK